MIIRTILDTDLYKFTTSYAYIKLFPYAIGTFSFKDRDGTEYSDEFVERLRTEISQLSHVALTEKELEYMIKNCRFLPSVYWEWLSSFRFQPEKIEIRLDENRQLHIEVNDYLYKATLYEVPLLAIVSEIKNQSSAMLPIWKTFCTNCPKRQNCPISISYFSLNSEPEGAFRSMCRIKSSGT